jgi:hypothetical protein
LPSIIYSHSYIPNNDLKIKRRVTGGSRNHNNIKAIYNVQNNKKILIAIGRYKILIKIPNTYPINEKSLCHGRKKFFKSRLIERLSSRSTDILPSILRCHMLIFAYHHLINCLKVYTIISILLSTPLSFNSC